MRAARATTYTVRLPNGLVQIHTEPGATVFIDGERIGETPLGPVSLTIGTRQVRVTHPELGEGREGIEVRHDRTADVSVNFQPRQAPADPSIMPPLSRSLP